MSVTPESIAQSLSFRLIRRFLGIAWYLLILATLIALVFMVAYVATGQLEPAPAGKGFSVAGGGLHLGTATTVPIHIAYEYDTDPHGERPIPEAVLQGRQVLVDGYDSVRLRLQDGYGAAYNALTLVFALGVLMAIVWQLRELCGSVAAGEAFREVNGLRLRRIGVIVLAGSLIYSIAQWATAHRYLGRVDIADASLRVDWQLHVDDLLLGLLLLVLGQLFQLGARIDAERQRLLAEQELTV